MNLSWIICKWKGHRWRRARKGEAATMKYCARCDVKAPVKVRVKKVPA